MLKPSERDMGRGRERVKVTLSYQVVPCVPTDAPELLLDSAPLHQSALGTLSPRGVWKGPEIQRSQILKHVGLYHLQRTDRASTPLSQCKQASDPNSILKKRVSST